MPPTSAHASPRATAHSAGSPARNRWRTLLVLLLRVQGTVMAMALFAVFMPTSWMATLNDSLGLGTMPEGPLVEYLTRSLSCLYATHGGIAWLASTDTRRLAPLVTFLGVVDIFFGLVVFGVDLWAGMPTSWTVGELIATVGGGIGVLSLQALARRHEEATGQTANQAADEG